MPYTGLREAVKAKSGLAFQAFLLCDITRHLVWRHYTSQDD
jgi:hypothetical protein